MTKDVAQANSTAMTAPDTERNFFEQYGDAMMPTVIVGQLLRFSKFGEYKAGQDDEDVPVGTQLVAYMPSLRVGWIRWLDNRPIEQKMGPLAEGFTPPKREELGATDEEQWEEFEDGRKKDPWQFSNQLVMFDPETGAAYTFACASKGGLGAIGELAKAYGKRIRQYPDEVPVVTLEVRKYTHTVYGEIRTPKFVIADWTTPTEEMLSIAAGDSNGEAAEAEAEQTRALPAPKRTAAKPAPAPKAATRPVPSRPAAKAAPSRPAAKPAARTAPPPSAKGKNGRTGVRF